MYLYIFIYMFQSIELMMFIDIENYMNCAHATIKIHQRFLLFLNKTIPRTFWTHYVCSTYAVSLKRLLIAVISSQNELAVVYSYLYLWTQDEDSGYRILRDPAGNVRKKSEKTPAGILLPSSGVFLVRSSGMRRKCTGSHRLLSYVFVLGK
jgi:hypothetical protein